MPTKISWATRTWNPVTGCTKISPGCAHCYAERLSLQQGWSKLPWIPKYASENIILHEDRLNDPLKWRASQTIFTCSMADLFHENVPDDFIERVFVTMLNARQHRFLVLTKRPERMAAWWEKYLTMTVPSRIGLGTSVENQYWVSRRIPPLLQIRAELLFLSCEPLLAPLRLQDYLRLRGPRGLTPERSRISWVIIGGESGPQHRPMHPQWAHDLVRQCRDNNIPVWFKQSSGPHSEMYLDLLGQIIREHPLQWEQEENIILC